MKFVVLALLASAVLTGCQSGIPGMAFWPQKHTTFRTDAMHDPFLDAGASDPAGGFGAAPTAGTQPIPANRPENGPPPIPAGGPIADPMFGTDPFLTSPESPPNAPRTSQLPNGLTEPGRERPEPSDESADAWRPTRVRTLGN